MPIFRRDTLHPQGNLGLWKIEEELDELLKMAKSLGLDMELMRDYKSELKQRQWLAARALVRTLRPDYLKITYDKIGAPLVDGNEEISLTHSHEMVGVIFGEQEVGIDLQHHTPKISRIKEKFCNKQELEFVSEGMEVEKLHVIWCAKESIYKRCKNPGMIFSEDMIIEPFDLNDGGELELNLLLGGSKDRLKLKYEFIGDYTLVYTLNI